MRFFLLMIVVLALFVMPVSAMEFTAPEAPAAAEEYMPKSTSTFGSDLWYVIKMALGDLQPDITEAAGICLSVIAVVLLTSILQSFSGSTKKVTDLVGTLGIGLLLIQPANTLVQLGVQIVKELSDYGKLLLPVMTAALAAQGGTTTSASLYAGTAFFDAVLVTFISQLLVPMLYIHICLCLASSAIKETTLKSLRDFSKWLITWSLKIILYIFTGYMGITGVVSGSADAAAIKATKLTITGTVPVVGSILSDASEAILVSAGVMKSTVGVYGLVAIIALYIGPFLKIGVQYLLLKITAAVCTVFGRKESVELIQDFSGAMGLLLAMTGTVCLMLLISTVCVMKGVH